jgi:eukaryotic-like serine/threonine-protein kinase
MAPDDRCLDCGAECRRGYCTRCLIRLGLEDPGRNPSAEEDFAGTLALGPANGRAGVFEPLAVTIGPLPRVLLRDAGLEEGAPPFVRPYSAEMPGAADSPPKLQLFGEIARGGMGAVLKGRDRDLGRELAVKVLLEQHRDRPELVRRFIEEAQIAGQLQHPGIVPIYDLGAFADRRPYFSMKLVKGRTLAELLAERESPTHDLARFLSIYEAVCQTMAYAHARGVIHRDLKPSNVMAGPFGEVQVMDWGLAKVLARGGVVDDASAGKDETPARGTVIATVRGESDGDLSKAGSIMGTPSYMAPEQARGEIEQIDERADVFALGSILCEMLTGQPAFVGRNTGEIQRKASDGNLADAVLRLDHCSVNGELVGLVKACLAHARDDRPRNAGAVAERVGAYLAGVQERLIESERERAAAEARAVAERTRRRLTLALAASVLALVALGGGGSAWVQKQREFRIADTAAAVNAALDRAALRRGEAEAATTDSLARWDAALAEAKQADDLARHGESDRALRGRATHALEALSRLRHAAETSARRAKADRALRAALADVRLRQSEGRRSVFFDLPSADDRYTQALRAAGIDINASDAVEVVRSSSVREDLLAALDTWIRVKRPDDPARSTLRKLADGADDNEWRRALRVAVERRDAAALRRLAASELASSQPPSIQTRLAVALADVGAADDAESILRQTQAKFPGDFWVNYELGSFLIAHQRGNGIGFLHTAIGIHPESAGARWALALAQRNSGDAVGSIRTFRELQTLVPEDFWVAINLGDVLLSQGEVTGAIAEFRRAIAINPDHLWGHYHLGNALLRLKKPVEAAAEFREAIRLDPDDAPARLSLGIALHRQHDLGAAVAQFREAIRLKPGLREAHANLSLVLRDQANVDEAIVECREALRLKPDCAIVQNNLGNLLKSRGKLDEAIVAFREATRLKPDYARAHANLGIALKERGKNDEAIAAYRESIRLKPKFAGVHNNLGIALRAVNKMDEAIREFREAIRLDPTRAAGHINLGALYCEVDRDYDAAASEFREAIRLQPDEISGLVNLGIARKGQGKFEEAVVACQDAIRVQPDCAVAHAVLGSALLARGDLDEAIAECREAVRLQPRLLEAHINLGLAVRAQRKLAEALPILRGAAELAPMDSIMARELPTLIRRVEQQLALRPRLPGVLAGDDRPTGADETVTFAQLARDEGRCADAVRLWAAAMSGDAKLADDRANQHRYNAACAAALAGSGRSKDDPALGETERAKLREEALSWLKAERTIWAAVLETDPAQVGPVVVQALQDWRTNRDLASVREPDDLAKLPSAEQASWRTMWADVDSLLKKARPSRG